MIMPTRWISNAFLVRLFVCTGLIGFGVTTIWLHGQSVWMTDDSSKLTVGDPASSTPFSTFERVSLHRSKIADFSIVNVTTHPETSRTRILVGIASHLNDNVERQRRLLNRKTYLDFDRLHRPDQPNRVCSLSDFLAATSQIYQDCQMIYTFVLGPSEEIMGDTYDTGDVLSKEMFQENHHETDVVYINVDENNMVGKRWGWFRYVSSLINSTKIPIAAYTDCHVMIQPHIFWEKNLFFNKDPTQIKAIYGGKRILKENCFKIKCTSLKRDSVMRRFVVLSSDLVHYLAVQSIPNVVSTDAPDVAIANVLHSYPQSIQEVDLQGLDLRPSQTVGTYLERFDKYKDSLVNYTIDPYEVEVILSKHPTLLEQQNSKRKPRILLGIFSMNDSTELERRDMIRKTYLRAFVNSDTPHRICRLHVLATMDSMEEQACDLAYAFIIGGNTTGPMEYVEETNTGGGPIALQGKAISSSVRVPDHDKDDIVYLNIRENMKRGKSQTFFKFATMVIDQHYFDYVAKTDTDTLVYPKALLEKVVDKLPKFPNNVRIYAGEYRIKPSTPVLQVGPAYMGGHFYLMSTDLARYVTSSACNRSALAVFSEDTSMGNFIHSHHEPIHRIWMKSPPFLHPVKRINRFKKLYGKDERGS